ncbi:MAG: virulence protein RhuM/Fic/DOC family protein, partial [Bacteroidales bacterium]|nr:virulence protein RhuM/Fic/DOC family protein [Bacteroidales bacterium]
STIRNFRTVQMEGKREVVRAIDFYTLDVIISVGYRVKSQEGTKFRIWANKILKEYLIKGYALSQKRLQQKGMQEFNEAIALLHTTINQENIACDEAKGLLDVIINYGRSWSLLEGYDEDNLPMPSGHTKHKFVLEYGEAKDAIVQLKKELMKKGEASDLFGREKAGEFDGIVGNIYQTFGGDELIPSVEAKAANLLYYIIKDHAFVDGNKRIGAFLFILFLQKNKILCRTNGEAKINDNALVALTLMTAKSLPQQKDTVIALIVNMLVEDKSI